MTPGEPPDESGPGEPAPGEPAPPQRRLPRRPAAKAPAPPQDAPEAAAPAAAPRPPRVALALSGGVALGAYHAGAYGALDPVLPVTRIAASSIGAVAGAIIASNPPERRAQALNRFWDEAAAALPMPALPAVPFPAPPFAMAEARSWRQAASWAGVLQSRLLGRPGLFSPSLPQAASGPERLGLYTLAPLRRMLARFVDFDRLNAGPGGGAIPLSVTATDLGSGAPVRFDTGRGDAIGPEHILASCGFLPDFAPTEIGGRLYGDGGLAANAPLEAALDGLGPEEDLICFVIDLFARDAGPPKSLGEALGHRRDLMFSNQTHRALEALRREDALRRALAGADPAHPEARRGATAVLHLSRLPAPDEAGPEMQFDFSRASLDARRRAGAEDMAAALALLGDPPAAPPGFSLRHVRRPSVT